MDLEFDLEEYIKQLRLSKNRQFNCPMVGCDKVYKSVSGMHYHLSCMHKIKWRKKTNEYDSNSGKSVEFKINDGIFRVGISETLQIIPENKYEGKNYATKSDEQEPVRLPEPQFTIIDDYKLPKRETNFANGYIRFIERTPEDEAIVEYDMDEEDSAWLAIINEKRAGCGLAPVTDDTFEFLMDWLEKECEFETHLVSGETLVMDEDAVCCICNEGEGRDTNVILFCDMCNLPVHQDCYGVPYIPDGQWLCRRCTHSPSRQVDCLLCPNTDGAFKQTDRGYWVHIICASWIPEVRFANAVFLEPIDSIESIPPARWKLRCYVCKEKGVGVCIQCHKSNCPSSFHVTCAQRAGLYMKVNTANYGQSRSKPAQRIAFCSSHTPSDAVVQKKPISPTTVAIPRISPERIHEIGSLVKNVKINHFIPKIIAFWALKRHFRNGVPLIRHLTTLKIAGREDTRGGTKEDKISDRPEDRLRYWKRFRQDLEKARLLCELIRKREKLKKELNNLKIKCIELNFKIEDD